MTSFGAGEAMVLQNNYFIEEILPNAILRTLSAEEMAEYRRPFAEPGEGRRPTLTWPRQIPIEGEPADVHAIATEYADWLGTSNLPKLFLKAEPGAILTNDTLVNLVRGWPALTEKTVAGVHFVQEDLPGRNRKSHRRLDWNVGLTGPCRATRLVPNVRDGRNKVSRSILNKRQLSTISASKAAIPLPAPNWHSPSAGSRPYTSSTGFLDASRNRSFINLVRL